MEESTAKTNEYGIPGRVLFGRRDIFSGVDEITEDNVIAEVNSALVYHMQNVAEEEYLYWYRRGLQPILKRTKERNEIILNKVVENIAEQIVTFKDGYLLQEPAKYVSRRSGANGKVNKLNEYLYRADKHNVDNAVADWFHMVGKGVVYIESNDDEDIPVKTYAIDPRSAFVVYSLRPGNKPVYAVNMVIGSETVKIDVYTKDKVFRLSGASKSDEATTLKTYEALATTVDKVEDNPLGAIPIIEYRYNSVNMGAFESVIYLLDAINNVQSNRIDGVEQFIQSIAVAVNCQFDDDVTADKIRKSGMIALRSIGENKADFKILSEELNQDQTQTLVDDLYEKVLSICAMPSTNQKGTSASITGTATIFNNGWEQAAASARNTEDLFKQSNRMFDEIFTDILHKKGLLDIKLIDFDLNFIRNETAGAQSKAQAMQTMLAAGMNPELAFAKSGISNDPVADVKMSEPYLRMVWGDPSKADEVESQTNGQGEAEIVESDNDNGENATGGSV